jgi:hypothetical protein
MLAKFSLVCCFVATLIFGTSAEANAANPCGKCPDDQHCVWACNVKPHCEGNVPQMVPNKSCAVSYIFVGNHKFSVKRAD